MPMPKKPDHLRQRRSPSLAVIDGGSNVAALPAPRPPSHWLKPIKDEWSSLWAAPLAQAWDRATDVPALRRLFDLRDERERYMRAVRKEPVVKGSQGQPVANPLGKSLPVIDSEIRQLEDRFGLTPASRFRLGIKIGQAAEAVKAAADVWGDGSDDDDADDFADLALEANASDM